MSAMDVAETIQTRGGQKATGVSHLSVVVDETLAAERRDRARRIDDALSGAALTMVFQPIVNLTTGKILGVEALARFTCEPRRPPNEWFEEAAAIGRGTELELAAVAAALGHLDRLPSTAFVAVNVSPATAATAELARLLEPFPGHRIVLEVTEHTPIHDHGALAAALDALRERGVRVAADDTGAGYCDLQRILDLRPEVIKLDIALTRGIDDDPARRGLVTALASFARDVGAVIVAEGIETAQEHETLRGLGVTLGQGYHLGSPVPSTDIVRGLQPLATAGA